MLVGLFGAPLGASPIREPHRGRAYIGRHMFQNRHDDRSALELKNFDRVMRVPDGSVIERCLDAIVSKLFPNLKCLTKLGIFGFPSIKGAIGDT